MTEWLIVPESDACAQVSDGTLTVAVVCMGDGAMIAESCWASVAEAAAHIEAMSEPSDDLPDERLGNVTEEASAVNEMTELEKAAAVADRVSALMGRLTAVTGEPREMADETMDFGAIRIHSTGFSDDPWDGAAQEVNVRSPEAENYFGDVYAWRDDNADTTVKAAYRFIHHFVANDGRAGAASTVACSSGIGVLNGGMGGTTIPDADRQGVYDHLAHHLRDAGREAPALMSQDAYEAALADSNAVLAGELATPVAEGGLAGLEDEALIAELARRWASGLAEKLRQEPAAEMSDIWDAEQDEEPAVDVDIEVTVGDSEEEDEGAEAPEGMECCPMCSGECSVEVNGISAVCPNCEGTGWTPVPEEAPMGDMMEMSDAPSSPLPFDWEGVLIVEGLPSGDGRMISEGSLTWRELPIPLMLQTVNAAGHDGAMIAGSIHQIERDGQSIVGRGFFDSGAAGQEARRLLSEGTMRGVSADIDSVQVSYTAPTGETLGADEVLFGDGDVIELLTAGRIMGATLTPFPAFQEAFVTVLMPGVEDAALVAAGADAVGAVWRVPSRVGVWVAGRGDLDAQVGALVASAGRSVEVPVNPPKDWFLPGEMSEPTPFTVHADGRCYGLVARWGSCHIGFTDRCQPVPRTGSAYRHFRNKSLLTAEGDLVATGAVFMDTVHPNLRLVASDAQAFYADTGCGVADVALYENEHGIVAAGALRPGLTPEQVRRFRGSDVSPDWRMIDGRLEVVGLLSVNVSGFIVEGLVASGSSSAARGAWDSVSGDVTALVAAGMVRRAQSETERVMFEIDALRAEVVELREALRPLRAERAAASLARAQVFGVVVESCGCDSVDGACACE